MAGKSFENVSDLNATKDKGLLVSVREGASVLPLFLRRLSEDSENGLVIGLEQVGCGRFRKIEPKPRTDNHCEVHGARLLESKSTRRGVRICSTCQGRVGYRSKDCKHCLLSSGISNKPTTKLSVKKKRTRQRKQKVTTKRNSKLVSKVVVNTGESLEESCDVAIDTCGVQVNDTKSDEGLLYVPTTSSTLETISNIDYQFHGSSNHALSVETECSMPQHHGDILYKTQIQTDERDECSFDKEEIVEEQVHCLGEINQLSENLDNKKFPSSNTGLDLTSPGLVREKNIEEVVKGNSGLLYRNVDLKQPNQNHETSMRNCLSNNLADAAGELTNGGNVLRNMRNNSKSQANSMDNSGESLSHNVEHMPSTRNISPNSYEEPSLASMVVQSEEGDSPVLLVNVNSINSISVTTSKFTQTTFEKEYNVAMNSSEDTFVFETTDPNSISAARNMHVQSSSDISKESVRVLAENKVAEDVHEIIKQKKKTKIWEGKKRKPKVSNSVQFVRIEPKPFLQISDDSSVKKDKQGILKQNRLLSSNPTRRGVMLCPLCQKNVGCRSRTCKYCKVAINLCPTKSPLEQKNLLAVELYDETCPQFTIFSVKKTLNASEERCFVKKAKTNQEENEMTSYLFSCDCVENYSVKKPCEHSLCISRGPNCIPQAKKTTLNPSKIDLLPIDFIFKLKLAELWETIKDSDFPFVQQVCQNTLVVLDLDSNVQTSQKSCVHVRFEKIRRRNNTELHIFCSGKTCSVWNEVDESGKDVPVTCIHYCVSLWAIASDANLQKYLKSFLDASQVFLHSEVFDGVLKD